MASPPQRQHILSAWLLRAFASSIGGRPTLAVFDKSTGTYETTTPDDFLVELGAHSSETEDEISD
jgi:hypothetical protein